MAAKINHSYTVHAIDRQHVRLIVDAQIEATIEYGHALYGNGIIAYCLLKNDLPAWMPADIAAEWHGTTVITEAGVKIVTMYKDYGGRNFAKLRKRFGKSRNH